MRCHKIERLNNNYNGTDITFVDFYSENLTFN